MFIQYLSPILTAILGLVMIFAAEPIIKVIIIAVGVYTLVSGIYVLTTTSKLLNDKSFKTNCYIRGAFNIILGLCCIILPISIAQFAWKAMMIIMGISAIISAISELYSISKLKSKDISTKKYIYELLLTLIAGIVAFLLPSSFGFTLIKIAGIILIVISIFMAISIYRNKPIIIEEAEIVDQDEK